MSGEVLRYLLVGMLNTLVGLAVIFSAMYLGVGDVVANALGYFVGFLISYSFNASWTFKTRITLSGAVKYLCLISICYILNVGVLIMSRDALHFNAYLAQICGVGVYTLLCYVGARFFVFR